MSRRFQTGSIEVSGKWYVVRFWRDVPGKDRRVHASVRICPVSGTGSLNKTERERLAQKILSQSGINDPQQFVETTCGVTFREQAKTFIRQKTLSKRKPIRPATLSGWEYALNKWLLPDLGDTPLSQVNNLALKKLIGEMSDGGLSPQTIVTYTNLAKFVVASAKNSEGEQLFPRKWDSEFMELPIIGNQHQPSFLTEHVSKIVANSTGQERMLYALLAGTGLRAGEVLGLEIGKHISADCRTLFIRQSVWEGNTQDPKTKNAHRDVDLCPLLANALRSFIGDRSEGFLFINQRNRPLLQTNILKRGLHPLLTRLCIPRMGFHAFRRFRATFLTKSRVPDSLVRFWLGHSNKSITDEYVKLFEEMDYRKGVADSIGLGFELPAEPIVRNVRRISKSTEVGIAA